MLSKLLVPAVLAAALPLRAADPAVRFLPQPSMEIGGFWGAKLDLLEKNWLPHAGELILKEDRLGPMRCNFVEALCLALERHPNDAKLRELLAICVTRDLAMQQKDGYVGSTEPRYTNLDSHEFYLHGYFLEAAARYTDFTNGEDLRYFAAGKRLADHLDATFGPAPKRTWTNGHPGLEKALMTFSDCVRRHGDAASADRYAKLSQYFMRHQFDIPELRRDYAQSDVPATEMSDPHGHAVRATYFYTGLAGAGWRCDDAELAASSRRIFDRMVDRKWYLSGGVGAKWIWEAFDGDYELTNGRGYSEGCASCGVYDWCTELTQLDGPGRTEDVRERLMYNELLGVFDANFTHYAYPNPMHGESLRYSWHTIPCCVANVPRVLEDYKNRMWALGKDGKTLYLNHFLESRYGEATINGVNVRLDLHTRYPADGKLNISFRAKESVAFDLMVRFPNRAESALYTAEPSVESGYKRYPVSISCSGLASVTVELPMPLQRITCDERVAANRGQVAWQQGPLVYAWEGADLTTRVPYCDRLNHGGLSFVWKPADGSRPDTTLEDVPWPNGGGNPIRDDGSLVPHARLTR